MTSIRGWIENIRQEKVMTLIYLICAVTLIYFVAYPLGVLVAKSFLKPKVHEFTLLNYAQFFMDRGIYEALLNTIQVALGTLLLGMGIGVPMAWGVSRTNMPLKGFIRSMVVLTFATPTFLTALAWIILLGPKAGIINETIRILFSLKESPFNIFSMNGLIFVLGIFLYPFVFFSTSAALDNMDPSMEEASVVLGASKGRTLFGITLPLIAPAIFSGGILIILQSFALFGAPAVIGMPAKIYTIATKIYSFFYFPPRFEMAAAVATPMILMTAILLIGQRIYLGRKQYITMGGTRTSPQIVDIGIWKYVLCGLSLFVIVLSIFLPFLALLSVSIKKIFGNPYSLGNLSLKHYEFVFLKSPIVFTSLRNSFLLALSASIISLILALIIGWMVEKTKLGGRSILTFITLLCMSFPGIALALGLIFAFSSPPLNLYGTRWILLVGYVIIGLPVAFLFARTSLKQLGIELVEAARTCGSSWIQSMRDVTVPLIKGGILAGGIIIFVSIFRELGASILLYTGGNEVVSVLIYTYSEEGDTGAMAAISVIVLAINLVLVLIVRRLVGKGVMQL
jgi:iron(III) transport system permease protein